MLPAFGMLQLPPTRTKRSRASQGQRDSPAGHPPVLAGTHIHAQSVRPAIELEAATFEQTAAVSCLQANRLVLLRGRQANFGSPVGATQRSKSRFPSNNLPTPR